jgi:hypothetical protein
MYDSSTDHGGVGNSHNTPSALLLECIKPAYDPLKQDNDAFTSVRRGVTLTGPGDDPIWLNFLDLCERPASPATKVNIPQHGIDSCLKLQCRSGLPGAQRRAGPGGIDPAEFSLDPARRLARRQER